MYRTAWNLAAAVVCAVAAGILAAAPSGVAMTVTAVDVTPIAWHACPADPALDCAAYPVPLDYADRAAGTVDLALYRRPATDPAHRVATLFVNPGRSGRLGVQDDGEPGCDLLSWPRRQVRHPRHGPTRRRCQHPDPLLPLRRGLDTGTRSVRSSTSDPGRNQLPTVREVVAAVAVNPNTVLKAGFPR
jgi:hypothetical protein